jgi:hypothetical protein
MSSVSVASSCDESSGLDAAFSFDRVQADEVEGDVFEGGFPVDLAFAFDDRKRFQVRPLLGFMQALQVVEDRATACLDTAMVLFHAFGKAMPGVGGRMGLEAAPEVLDRSSQLGLVVLTART